MSSGKVTIADVARVAGVHISTVSRVLAGTEVRVRPETRQRVHDAADGLRYRPSATARSLRTATTGALGLLVPSLRNPVYAQIIRGAFERAWERDFIVVMVEDRGGAAAQAYETLVEQRRIDGLLIAGVQRDSRLLERIASAPLPCVFVNRRHLDGGHNVSMREEDAGGLAARHLLELGHTRLAHLAGPAGIDTADRRLAGFTAVARTAGVEPMIVHAAFDERAGHDAMAGLLRGERPPTGVFTSNINQAIGALASARTLDRAIPRDVSVITYDDDPFAEYSFPPLTVVRMPLHELGSSAVDVILDRIAGGPAVGLTIGTPPALVIRSSTGPPA